MNMIDATMNIIGIQNTLKLMEDIKSQLERDITIKMTMESMNVVLHIISIFLLLSTYKRGQQNSQHLYLINLSATELLKNLCYIVLNGINVHLKDYASKFSVSRIIGAKSMDELISMVSELKSILPEITTFTDASGYVALISYTAIYWIHILAMFLITIDRLLAAVLSVRYKSLCTVFRAKVIIAFSWILIFVIPAAAISGVYYSYGQNIRIEWWRSRDELKSIGLVYIPACLNFAFLLFAIMTYSVLFFKFIKTERRISSQNHSVFHMFRHSKFYVATLIIASFLFLTVIPWLVFFVIMAFEIAVSRIDLWLHICMRVSDTVDVLIYTFLYTPVQRLWMKKLGCFSRKPLDKEQQDTSTSGKGTSDRDPLNGSTERAAATSV